jgi:hypothetical protein
MLLDACHRNPFATDHLWLFALCLALEQDRTLPQKANNLSPIEKFAGVAIRPRTNHFHPFGCPTYVLAAPLQEGRLQPKWNQCSRVGCYLGKSPQQTRF